MKEITQDFEALYYPTAAIVIYQTQKRSQDTYVEYFDMDTSGSPVNAHPLTVSEGKALSKALQVHGDKQKAFLKPQGIVPTNVLHINPTDKGSVLWYTKATKQKLYFSENLNIPSGEVSVPALLWHADKQNLRVFALISNRRPTKQTTLYHAPFLNLYESAHVCMGTVDVTIQNSASLEEFTTAWQHYFFKSYFSHLINGHNPIQGDCIALWKDLVKTGKAFPKQVLLKSSITLQKLLL